MDESTALLSAAGRAQTSTAGADGPAKTAAARCCSGDSCGGADGAATAAARCCSGDSCGGADGAAKTAAARCCSGDSCAGADGPVTTAAAAARRWSGQQRLLLSCLCSGSVLSGALVALMIPFFPLEAAERGVSQTVIGGVFSSFAVTQLLVCPLVGRLVPRVGVSRAYCSGLALAGVSTAAFGALARLADTRLFIGSCFAARGVEALAVSLINTAALTMVANQFAGCANSAVSIMEASTGVGVSLGPAIGGGLYHLGGYGLPFYVLAVLMLIVGGVTYRCMPPVNPATKQAHPYWPLFVTFCRCSEAWLCCLVLLTVAINWASIDASIEPYVFKAIGITPLKLGLYFLVATGLFTLCSYFIGQLHDRIASSWPLTAAALLSCSVGMLLLAPSPLLPLRPSWWLLGVGMVVKEIGQGGAFIPIFPTMLRACTGCGMPNTLEAQSFLSSVFWTVFSVGLVLGPTVCGVIVDGADFPTMTTVLAGWSLLAAVASALRACCTHTTTSGGVKPPDLCVANGAAHTSYWT